MGRYFTDEPSARVDLMTNLRRNVGLFGQTAIQQKLQEQKRQQQLQDAIEQYKQKLELQKKMGVFNQPTTSINISEIPYSERLKAREISARSPEEWKEAGLATGGERLRHTGILGFGPGSQRSDIELSPEATGAVSEAKQILGSPYRTTRRISGKGGFGQPSQNVLGQGMPIETDQETEIDALKPANIPQEEWDLASIEDKIEFLRQAGLL